MTEQTYTNEATARTERRTLINRGKAVSLIAFDPERNVYVFDVEDEDDNECEGHESLSGASMGASYFCDGSCI